MKNKNAVLRVCASCEWIFKAVNNNWHCPKCGFGSYGARYVYGESAYQYAKTQKPWKMRKMNAYESLLDSEIIENFLHEYR